MNGEDYVIRVNPSAISKDVEKFISDFKQRRSTCRSQEI
jgi:hypothetical protein